jgi:hypothetical protein
VRIAVLQNESSRGTPPFLVAQEHRHLRIGDADRQTALMYPQSFLSCDRAKGRYEPHDFDGWTNCIVTQDDGNDDDPAQRVFQVSTY